MKKTASLTALAASFVFLPTLHAATVYTETFSVGANSSFASQGWSAYMMDESGSLNDLSSSTNDPAYVPEKAGNSGYASTHPRTSTSYDGSDGPSLKFTTEPVSVLDSTNIADLVSISLDVQADGSVADPALGRYAIQVGGQWYASEITVTSDTNTGPDSFPYPNFSTPALFDFTDGNNWRLMAVTLGAGGDLSVAGSAVGGTLVGDVTAFGFYAEHGNDGDHFRIDNYTVQIVPEPGVISLCGLVGLVALRRRR